MRSDNEVLRASARAFLDSDDFRMWCSIARLAPGRVPGRGARADRAVSRYRRRPSGHKDSNHDAIVRELRQCGASVLETHALGSGAPDLIVGYQGVTALIEIKNGEGYHQTQREKRLRLERQQGFLDAWRGARRSWRKRRRRCWRGSPTHLGAARCRRTTSCGDYAGHVRIVAGLAMHLLAFDELLLLPGDDAAINCRLC